MSGRTAAPGGGFTADLSPDISEGEEDWRVSRIGADQTTTQNGGTLHLSKSTDLMDHRDTSPAP